MYLQFKQRNQPNGELDSHDSPNNTVDGPLVFGFRSPGMESDKNAVIPGEFIVEPPTLMNLGFEWSIQGDDNRNAKVAVEYRKRGQSEWKEALPLLRIGDEKVWRAREYLEYWTPRMFAGSILDLEEETTYQCRFTLSDPDGVRGQAVQEATVTNARRPEEPYRGTGAACLSARLSGSPGATGLQWSEGSLLWPWNRRLERGERAPRASRRHHPGSRGAV